MRNIQEENTKPPYSLEAEQAVLGSILIEPACLADIQKALTPADFYKDDHRTIYETLLAMQKAGTAIDILTLADALRKLPAPEHAREQCSSFMQYLCGNRYLPLLADAPATAANAAEYARVVQEKAALRLIMHQAAEAYHLAACSDLAKLSAGNGHFNLSAIISGLGTTSETRPICLADVEAETVEWLWRGWIPYGKISMIVGDPGLGKSNLILDIAARLTIGKPMPFNVLAFHAASDVLLLMAEDGLADTVRPRMEAAGADLRRVHAYRPEDALELLSNIERLERDIRHHKVRMVVADPLMAFFPSALDSHKDQHARRVLSPIASLAQNTGAAFVFVHHPNKNGEGRAVYRAGGSIGIIGATRAAALVAQDPADPQKRILASIKHNLCKPPQSLRFHLEAALDVESNPEKAPPRTVWDEVANGHTADTLFSAPISQNASELDEAVEFLRESLADGPVKVTELECAAKVAGISISTLKRARNRLSVKAEKIVHSKDDTFWQVSLPSFACKASNGSPEEASNSIKEIKSINCQQAIDDILDVSQTSEMEDADPFTVK